MAPRVSVLPGDLGKPSLGLTPTILAQLADEVDVIINNGALVNVSKGYGTMKSSNVDAVKTLLELCSGGLPLLHCTKSVLWVLCRVALQALS